LNIVATSCNTEHPMTSYDYLGPEQAMATFYVGYYQDETHRGGRGGHYDSLREIPETIVEEVVQSEAQSTIATMHYLAMEMIKYKDNPEVLLKVLTELHKEHATSADIESCDVAGLLMDTIRPLYSVETKQGRLARRYIVLLILFLPESSPPPLPSYHHSLPTHFAPPQTAPHPASPNFLFVHISFSLRLLNQYADMMRADLTDWEPLDMTTVTVSPISKQKRTFRDIFRQKISTTGSSVSSSSTIASV
jgi:hypothetical protein